VAFNSQEKIIYFPSQFGGDIVWRLRGYTWEDTPGKMPPMRVIKPGIVPYDMKVYEGF